MRPSSKKLLESFQDMRMMLKPDDIHLNIKGEVANFQSDIVQGKQTDRTWSVKYTKTRAIDLWWEPVNWAWFEKPSSSDGATLHE